MFEKCKNTNVKGTVGLGRCIYYFTKLGFTVSLPLNDSQDYDLIFDDGEILNKVQVKTTSQEVKSNIFRVKLESYSHNFNKNFDKDSVDFLFVLCENNDSYLIPSKVIEGKTAIHIGNKYKQYLIER